jgi:hypothetical protein
MKRRLPTPLDLPIWMQLRLLSCCIVMLFAGNCAAATLNKCVDAHGKVTYSNLPCHNVREAYKLEIDPPPQPDPVRSTPKALPTLPSEAARSNKSVVPKKALPGNPGKPAANSSSSKCDSLSDKLGRVLDKVDAARRKGYTQQQMDDWNKETRALERQKQQAGCF